MTTEPKRIISVHAECKVLCQHKDVCYSINRTKVEKDEDQRDVLDKVMKYAINGTSKVYMATCDAEFEGLFKKLKAFHNLNVTVSFNIYNKYERHQFNGMESQLQVSVYREKEFGLVGNDITKLYLVKNDESFNYALELLKGKNGYKNIHLPIDQGWAKDNKDDLIKLVRAWQDCRDETISLDSCLMGYITHGKCDYVDQYIDVHHDGTLRTCPFTKSSRNNIHDLEDEKEMFGITHTPKCIYSKYFG
tara:strand:- start:444 stop:1187 length:744 start_codon:yes stop_codon:yes gene_type:complete